MSLHFSEFLCIPLHFSTFHCIYLHFSALLFISLHFSESICISLHFSTFFCISLHFTFYILRRFDGAYCRPVDAIFFYQMLNTFKLTTSSEYAALDCAPYSLALSVPQLWSEDCLPHSSRPASRPYSECQGSLLQPLHCCTFHCENWAWHRVYRD